MAQGVDARSWLVAVATLSPPRASSLRAFARLALDGLEPGAGRDGLAARAADWLQADPPADDEAAGRVLVAEDLRSLLAASPPEAPIGSWAEPVQVLQRARDAELLALVRLGITLDPPPIHLDDRLPPPYDHPSLAVISIDRSDASAFGLPAGIHVDRRRLAPFFSEAAVGHVLVHVALGERSPEHLGRGLEEGIAELLGALHAASSAIGAEAAEACFRAYRLTPTLSAHRAAFMDEVRRAALIHTRFGLEGLARLVREGRGAVKQIEGALARGDLEAVPLVPDEPDPGLHAMLERLLAARGRPLVVSPLAFYLTRALRAGRSVEEVADELGVPRRTARQAAEELMASAFVLVLSEQGEVLVDDLDLVLGAGSLRYGLES